MLDAQPPIESRRSQWRSRRDDRLLLGIEYVAVDRFARCDLSITVIASVSEAIQSRRSKKAGLLRCARNDRSTLDRIRLGAVIDFLNASKLGFVWVFNGADCSIDVGNGHLLPATFLTRPGTGQLSTAADEGE